MPKREKNVLEALLETLEVLGNKVERIASMFLDGLLKFLETTYEWLVDAIRRTKEYLSRLFIALAKIVLALGKLLLFYSPIVVFILLYYITEEIVWIVSAVIWFVLITAICLAYGKRIQTENAEKRNEEEKDQGRPVHLREEPNLGKGD